MLAPGSSHAPLARGVSTEAVVPAGESSPARRRPAQCWQCGLASINTAHAGPPAPGSARTRRLPLYVAYYRLALCRGRVGVYALALHVQCIGCVAMMPQLAPPTPGYPAPSPRNPPHVPATSSLRAAMPSSSLPGILGRSVKIG